MLRPCRVKRTQQPLNKCSTSQRESVTENNVARSWESVSNSFNISRQLQSWNEIKLFSICLNTTQHFLDGVSNGLNIGSQQILGECWDKCWDRLTGALDSLFPQSRSQSPRYPCTTTLRLLSRYSLATTFAFARQQDRQLRRLGNGLLLDFSMTQQWSTRC